MGVRWGRSRGFLFLRSGGSWGWNCVCMIFISESTCSSAVCVLVVSGEASSKSLSGVPIDGMQK